MKITQNKADKIFDIAIVFIKYKLVWCNDSSFELMRYNDSHEISELRT